MKYDRTDIAKGFMKVAQKSGKKRAIKELAALILEQRTHSQVEEIVQDISAQQLKENGFIEVELKTAYRLSEKARKSIENYIYSKTNAKQILIHETVDKSLLAGIHLTAPGLELDTTFKSKLAQLKV